MITITVSPRRVVRWLVACAIALVVLGVAGQLLRPWLDHGFGARVLHLLHLDAERTLASWYAALTLLLCAGLLALCGSAARRAADPTQRRFAVHWTALSLLFVYLSLDEAVGLHELLTRPMQQLTGASGWLHFAWVIPAAGICAILFLALIPFLGHLPRRTAVQFVVAGGVFVLGAIGLEIVSGQILTVHDSNALTYQLTAAAEETLEMIGVLVFIHALLAHLSRGAPEIMVRLTNRDPL